MARFVDYWNERPKRHGGPIRLVAELLVSLVIAVTIIQGWLVERFVVPSGSMAETLHGAHRAVTCPDCGYHFAAGNDVTDVPLPREAVCPNCGCPEATFRALPSANGDRVLVQKTAFAERAPRRWEVIVFRCPEEAEMVYVKRVVGLPGESVQVVGGDVIVDGRLQRKSVSDCRALALTVYDDAFRPHRERVDLPPRFQGDAPHTRWQADGPRYVLAPPEVASEQAREVDWLTYRHWRRVRGFPDHVEEVPINDDCGYNQAESRVLNYVADVGLRGRVRCHGSGELWLSASDGREQFQVSIAPHSGLVELWHHGRPVARREHHHALAQDWCDLEVYLFDRQLHVGLAGEPLLEPYAYEPAGQPFAPTTRPLAVGARGLFVELEGLRVVRDVYYTRPSQVPHPWGVEEPFRLAADEYFVLGDNSSLSKDSRFWSRGPAVPSELLVGKPFLVHMPSQAVELGPLELQFPRLSQVRYIR